MQFHTRSPRVLRASFAYHYFLRKLAAHLHRMISTTMCRNSQSISRVFLWIGLDWIFRLQTADPYHWVWEMGFFSRLAIICISFAYHSCSWNVAVGQGLPRGRPMANQSCRCGFRQLICIFLLVIIIIMMVAPAEYKGQVGWALASTVSPSFGWLGNAVPLGHFRPSIFQDLFLFLFSSQWDWHLELDFWVWIWNLDLEFCAWIFWIWIWNLNWEFEFFGLKFGIWIWIFWIWIWIFWIWIWNLSFWILIWTWIFWIWIRNLNLEFEFFGLKFGIWIWILSFWILIRTWIFWIWIGNLDWNLDLNWFGFGFGNWIFGLKFEISTFLRFGFGNWILRLKLGIWNLNIWEICNWNWN